MKTTYALLAGLAAHQVSATWSLTGKPFSSPQYANNECSDKQKGGFDWSDLKDGDSNFQYGDFDFSKNWKCSNSFGKRDAITKRTFGNKAITNKCTKDKPASFGCDKRKDGFSITTIDVSVEFDVEIDLHYTMTDGSLCKQKSVPCKKDGSTIQNTQCGGAKSVDVYLGNKYKGDKSECQIGFHHIGFDCDKPVEYKPPPPPQPPKSTPVPPKDTPSPPPPPPAQSSPAPCYGKDCGAPPPPPTSSKPCEGEACKPPQSTPAASSPPASTPCVEGAYGPGCPPPAQSTPVVPPPVSSPAPYANSSIPAPPTYQTTIVPPPSYQSSTVTPLPESSKVVPPPTPESSSAPCNGQYGGSCGASSPVPPPPASSPGVSTSPPAVYSASTPVPGVSSSPAPETSSAPPSQPSYPVYPPSSYPPKEVGDVLPNCMNTWLQISTQDCKDNTNADCYCKNSKFTKNVIDCVQARCDTDAQVKETLQYLVGICAQHVPENPGLITDCPKDTFDNTPSSPPPAGSSPPPAGSPPAQTTPAPPSGTTPTPSKPVTTIVYDSTSLTVPAVHFTTEYPSAGAPTPTAPVGLVPGEPPKVPATTTPAGGAGAPYPVPSTLKSIIPTGTGGVRPSSPAQFTGAAVPFKAEAKHVMLGAAIAFFAL
ncbi:hypothetical protein IQ06DRAFT_296158 [Phaeosphaeriaceae sp. SRC1lsM3a]|nr:hypothetical protein IQ06DRAFT_296158 [Stagonospora sp. SRC1lsM3a]